MSATQSFSKTYGSRLLKSQRHVIKAVGGEGDKQPLPGLPIDLRGKRAFIAGIADDNGYGWAIAKSLAAAGAEILVGTWVPALNIFETSLRRGKFDESRVLPDGSLMEITKVYPLDAIYDSLEDVPEDVKTNKRYSGSSNWTVKEVAESVKQDFGSIDILVHSLANGPEVSKPLLETSRNGYLAAVSASSYSFVSLLRHFLPIMNPDMVVHEFSKVCS
ncbi:UNVERIFIED_CONTAM: Enoyl-[acyl-carrier-protein] reductase [NADH] 1, chloroplastic [Sesamum radiatum]|uniref:Enoyl-[acyl-carrier-protein] reductase [NADH] 1, chloroplastic n=1 Tax=Sesamum radiatum TaxID=300843 RepID=A0AAW2N8R7_SESRA